jgi:hypothetical protein
VLDLVTTGGGRRKEEEEEEEEEEGRKLVERRQDNIVTMLAGVWSDSEFVSSTNWSRHV